MANFYFICNNDCMKQMTNIGSIDGHIIISDSIDNAIKKSQEMCYHNCYIYDFKDGKIHKVNSDGEIVKSFPLDEYMNDIYGIIKSKMFSNKYS